jgi:hypothetical protein
MSAIPKYLSRPFRAFLLAIVAVTLGGCVGSLTIEKPMELEIVTLPQTTLPQTTNGVVAGKSYSNLSVTTVTKDGRPTGHQDVTSQFRSMGPNTATADLHLPADVYTITASADLPCWYCTNGKRHSTDSNTFVVMGPLPSFCNRSGSTPVTTLPPGLIVAGQTPGSQAIMTKLNPTDSVLILVDDDPTLTRDQMRVT